MKIIKSLQFHHIFFLIGFIFGLKLVFVNPPWHSNDEDRHFFNAYNLSNGHLGPQVEGNTCGFILPVSINKDVSTFLHASLNDSIKMRADVFDDFVDKPLDAEKSKFYETPTCKLNPFAYIPSAIMINMGRLINSSPLWLCWWARIGSLFAYLIITYFAIKKIPTFKSLLMLVALSPMALFQGASVTYDSLSFAFLFLFFSMLLAFYFQEQKITMRQVLLLALVAALQRLSKDGYFIVFFSLACISPSKFENKKVYFAGIALMVFASFVPPQIWTMYLNHLHLPAEQVLQKDYLFDVSKNIQFNIKNPIHTVGLLLLNIVIQSKYWIQGSIGTLGAGYTQIPGWLLFIQLFSMILVVLVEQKTKVISMRFRIPVLVLVLANCLAIIVMFFLAATPVGGTAIHGIQGRYFTPLLPFLFIFVFYTPKKLLESKRLNRITPVYVVCMLLFLINFLTNQYYH